MTALRDSRAADSVSSALHDRAEAERYVASVCFKHGPPRLVGVELEWTVHDADDPRLPLKLQRLAAALGPHAPTTVTPDSAHLPMPQGSLVTVEPGGQVEISAPPKDSLTALVGAVAADTVTLSDRLADAGLTLGHHGLDPHRPPLRLLDTPRYSAMSSAFARTGPDGLAWMCSTAGLQVCLDAGQPDRVATRWAAAHALGPVLSALFANSAHRVDGCFTWVSGRMRTMFRTDPVRNRPCVVDADPAAAWARHAVDAPVICVRRPDGPWEPPAPLTFAEWIGGALPEPPTEDDLDYHLSTLFPPVRPRGYLEVRYLDAQSGDGWLAPAAVLTALFADEDTVDAALAATEPAAGRWLHAARYGLGDERIARAARDVVALAEGRLARATDLDADAREAVVRELARRLDHPESTVVNPGGGDRS